MIPCAARSTRCKVSIRQCTPIRSRATLPLSEAKVRASPAMSGESLSVSHSIGVFGRSLPNRDSTAATIKSAHHVTADTGALPPPSSWLRGRSNPRRRPPVLAPDGHNRSQNHPSANGDRLAADRRRRRSTSNTSSSLVFRLVIDRTPCLSLRIREKSCPVNQGATSFVWSTHGKNSVRHWAFSSVASTLRIILSGH